MKLKSPPRVGVVGPCTCLLLLLVAAVGACAAAEPEAGSEPEASGKKNAGGGPAEYRSEHFVLHTDLSQTEASHLLNRLEGTLGQVAKYWDRKPRGRIECYVVGDMRNWQDSSFPDAFAPALILGVGGGTFSTFERTKLGTRRKAVVYANARRGVAEHESVHAYCSQNFLDLGPDWYKEGMAQMAYYHTQQGGKPELACEKSVVQYLRSGPPKSVTDVVNGERLTLHIEVSLAKLTSGGSASGGDSTRRDAWIEQEGDAVARAKESYHWCWALCHLLSQNPNYAKRFRLLGLDYLNRRSQTFEQHFGTSQNELGFEYEFFLKRIDVGYRVDLCSWDWTTRFHPFDAGRPEQSTVVSAARGFQASGMLVSAGGQYGYEVDGSWRTSAETAPTDATGDKKGRGRLMGAVLAGYDLGRPFDLGASGSFRATADGKLYLRCRDAWNGLSDNSGQVTVRVRPLAADGSQTAASRGR